MKKLFLLLITVQLTAAAGVAHACDPDEYVAYPEAAPVQSANLGAESVS